jgi:glycosyltransferase involved in cell wall biosynthesis
MRFLVLSDKLPSRTMGDGLRLHGLLRPLKQRHVFDLIALHEGDSLLEPSMRELFDDVLLVASPVEAQRSVLVRAALAATIGNLKPNSQALRAAISEKLTMGRHRLVLEVAGNTVASLPKTLGVPLVVDAIDEPLLREIRAIRSGTFWSRAHHAARAWRFWAYERAFLGSATSIVFAAEEDAQMYRRFFPGRHVEVVPNGVDTEFFRPQLAVAEPDSIVFEGNMNFAPNVDAARRLVQDILPELSTMGIPARVMLVGRDPSPEVRALAGSTVTVTGTVADIRPYLVRGSVFACPMRLGSGIKNKILQAWAMGRPVVATSQSLGGLRAQDGFNLLVRDNSRAFAQAIALLLKEPTLAATIGAAGRATVEREYSWQYRSLEFERALLSAVGHLPRGLTTAASA